MIHLDSGRFVLILLACFLILTLSGCEGGERESVQADIPASEPTSTAVPETPTAKPVASATKEVTITLEQPVSPLQPASPEQPISPLQPESPLVPESARAEPQPYTLEIPEPDDDTGVVIGRVIAESPSARVFLAGQFYLGQVIYSEGEIVTPVLSLNVGNDPLADLRNDTGEFAFFNVSPGQYGFVIYTPMSSFAAPDEGKEGLHFFDVEPGQVLDLGEIIIE